MIVTSAFGLSFAPPLDEPKQRGQRERQGCGERAAGERGERRRRCLVMVISW